MPSKSTSATAAAPRTSTGETLEFDIVIVGGGPVGMTLALSLTRYMSGLKVAICDIKPFTVPKDARASAIAAGVQRVFKSLNVWEAMAPHTTPIEKMAITDSGEGDLARPLFLSFEGDVAPGEPYAHMVPNRASIGALLAALEGKVTFLTPVNITGLSTDAVSARLSLADGRTLSAPLVVAADGARSALRGMAGIPVTGHDYGQSGIVTTIAHALEHENTAYEHFRPAGPFASLPLPGKTSSLVWTERTETAQALIKKDKAELARDIEAAMGSSLGHVEVVDLVQAFPLRLQIAKRFHADRLALIGDAAHMIHPISGQGLNLGLKDVAALSEILIEAIRLGRDHGAADVLESYTRWRRFDTALMAMATDGLNKLFSNDLPPVRALRDLGLGIVDRMPLVKTGLIRHAAGIGGQTPRLMQGRSI